MFLRVPANWKSALLIPGESLLMWSSLVAHELNFPLQNTLMITSSLVIPLLTSWVLTGCSPFYPMSSSCHMLTARDIPPCGNSPFEFNGTGEAMSVWSRVLVARIVSNCMHNL
ncbi:hypothetical protein TorRG33x02_335420, partial [Trema orientale]